MRLLHTWLKNRDQFDELASLLGPNGIGLIDEIAVQTFNLKSAGLTGGKEESEAAQLFYFMLFRPAAGRSSEDEPEGKHFGFSDLSAGMRPTIPAWPNI